MVIFMSTAQGIVLKFVMKPCTGETLIRRNDIVALLTTEKHGFFTRK